MNQSCSTRTSSTTRRKVVGVQSCGIARTNDGQQRNGELLKQFELYSIQQSRRSEIHSRFRRPQIQKNLHPARGLVPISSCWLCVCSLMKSERCYYVAQIVYRQIDDDNCLHVSRSDPACLYTDPARGSSFSHSPMSNRGWHRGWR